MVGTHIDTDTHAGAVAVITEDMVTVGPIVVTAIGDGEHLLSASMLEAAATEMITSIMQASAIGKLPITHHIR